MRKIKIILPLFSLIILVLSCDWIFKSGPCDASGPVIVYKTNQDYSNKVTIQLSEDGKTVTAYPGSSDAARQRPIQLANGYFLKRMVGDAVLSLTIDEYSQSIGSLSPTDLYNLIIDKSPYLEKYECCNCTGQDTAVINDLIRKNQLPKCDNLK